MLSERERALFARLSVFAGGFDLDAAHGVCRDPADGEDDTLDLLAGLVDKSMVTADHTADATWYRLLETMRQYGRERLLADAEPDTVHDRHARYLVDLTERAGVGLLGPDEAHWVERLSRAYDDVRVAVRWAIERQDTDLALRLVVNLPDFAYWRVGYELTDWSEATLALPGAGEHPLAPAVHGGAARGAWCLGDYPRAIRLARACGPPEWVGGHVPLRQTRRRPGGHRRIPRADRGGDRPLRAPGRAGPAGCGSAAAELGSVPPRHVPRGGP